MDGGGRAAGARETMSRSGIVLVLLAAAALLVAAVLAAGVVGCTRSAPETDEIHELINVGRYPQAETAARTPSAMRR